MRYFHSLLFAVLLTSVVWAQSNPFAPIGREAPLLTLTKGLYPEVFTNDTLRIVCGMVYNRVTKQVVGFIEVDTVFSESGLKPELMSRWLSMDPLAAKYPSLSPYHGFANNPILVVDPNGKENIIYLVLLGSEKTILSKADMAMVATQATQRLKELGLKTEVRVFDAEAMGAFDPRNLDRTDSYALLGSVSNIRTAVNDKQGNPNQGFSAASKLIIGWEGGANHNPEEATLGKYQDRIEENRLGQGMVVDIDYMGTMSRDMGISATDAIALTVLHGATHNAGRRGHSAGGLNLKGDEAKSLVLAEGLDALYSPERNSVSSNAFKANFGDKPATDNYLKNRLERISSSPTSPHKGTHHKDY